jgi:peptidoglycan/xylan/chitin deacetylase (PgdA/CDA1 family)
MLKKLIYHICKWTGCFYVARRLTRGGLRILAYHGFALCDEMGFRPLLFMDAAVFRRRMEYLVRRGYPVLSLDDAVGRLRSRSLPPCATTVTFDDGFYSIWKLAVPVLRKLRLPATIYVTTYYCLKGNPVFRLVIQYMFWKTAAKELDINNLGLREAGKAYFPDARSANDLAGKIIRYAESQMNEDQRVRLCEELGRRLEVDYADIARNRFLTLMTRDEIREAHRAGVDIQLHTHRHALPDEAALVGREIENNREVLEPLVGRRLRHFCYPSGVYHKDHLRPLTEAGVISATTCDAGLNYPDTLPLALHRFLDGNNVSWIEFEAEMSGFSDLLRKARLRLTRLAHRGGDGPAIETMDPYAASEDTRKHTPRG